MSNVSTELRREVGFGFQIVQLRSTLPTTHMECLTAPPPPVGNGKTVTGDVAELTAGCLKKSNVMFYSREDTLVAMNDISLVYELDLI